MDDELATLYIEAMDLGDLYRGAQLTSKAPLTFVTTPERTDYPDDSSDLDDDEASDSSDSSRDSPPSDPGLTEIWPSHLDHVVYRFGEYQITKLLMNKSDRKIYAGFRKSDNERVVIVVSEDHNPRGNDVPREVRILNRFQGNAGVTQLLGWCNIDRNTYAILMKYHINCRLTESTFGDMYIISKVIRDLLITVRDIHAAGVIHRDIAIDNVLYDPLNEHVVVADFDSAAFHRAAGYTRLVGRTNYDSPEKKAGQYGEASDVYAVGIILWILITRNFNSPSPKHFKAWATKARKRKRHTKFPEVDLLLKLTRTDTQTRLTVADALKHPFLSDAVASPSYYSRRQLFLQEMGVEEMPTDPFGETDDDEPDDYETIKTDDDETDETVETDETDDDETDFNDSQDI